MAVFLIRKAIGKVKKKGYEESLAQTLNADGDSDCKFLCIANAKINSYSNVGLFGRPGLWRWAKSTVLDYLGKNQRTFAVIENAQGEKYMLAFNEEHLDDIVSQTSVNEVFKEAEFDVGFSTNFGFSVLALDSTSIVQGENEGQFIIRPKESVPRLRHHYYELNIVVDPRYDNSEKNAEETKGYLASVAVANT